MRGRIMLGIALLLGCGGALDPGYPTSTPKEAVVQIEMPTLQSLSKAQATKWKDHLAAHPHWQVRQDRDCTYAVRLEPRQDENGNVFYDGTLNGFFSDFSSADVLQTRVLTGLGCRHGFGNDRGQIVYTEPMAGPVQLVLEDYMNQPGTNSELLIEGGQGVTLEIYEQSKVSARPFTQAAILSVEAELAAVVAGTAVLPPRATRRGPPSIQVSDGMQPGMYNVEAWVNPMAKGETFTRVVYVGPAGKERPPKEVRGREGQALSADRMRPSSARTIGFSKAPEQMFRYSSGVMVYDGDWGQPYRARFEIWFTDATGKETKLAETERVIEGWMR